MKTSDIESMMKQIRDRYHYRLYLDSIETDGGPGSGNFGHAGRKGLIGGSAGGKSNKRKSGLSNVPHELHNGAKYANGSGNVRGASDIGNAKSGNAGNSKSKVAGGNQRATLKKENEGMSKHPATVPSPLVQTKTFGIIGGATPKDFSKALENAKNSLPDDAKWRVDSQSVSSLLQNHPGAMLHITKGGSTVAVTKEGDIISVCHHRDDTEFSGKDLLKMATESGGKKLDAFAGLYGFYRKCGFTPETQCAFSYNFLPGGWKEGRDEPEPIIFWRYTGEVATASKDELIAECDEWLQKTKCYTGDDGYGKAAEERDGRIGE